MTYSTFLTNYINEHLHDFDLQAHKMLNSIIDRLTDKLWNAGAYQHSERTSAPTQTRWKADNEINDLLLKVPDVYKKHNVILRCKPSDTCDRRAIFMCSPRTAVFFTNSFEIINKITLFWFVKRENQFFSIFPEWLSEESEKYCNSAIYIVFCLIPETPDGN
mgnify:CR=1 FL=1